MTADSTQRYRYQISARLMIFGLIGLGSALILLLVLAPTASDSIAWWVFTILLGGLFILTGYVFVSTRRHRPIEVVVSDGGIVLPVGALGTRTLELNWDAIDGIRMIGRATAFRRERNWEVTYLIHQDGYLPLICELFENMAEYERCRDAILHHVRQHNPDAHIDRDGVTLHTAPCEEGEPQDTPSSSELQEKPGSAEDDTNQVEAQSDDPEQES